MDSNYYLAGGTALSLLLGHRKSVDMDYFINGQIDTERLNLQLIEMFGIDKVKITFQEKDTLWVNIDGVKVFFITRLSALLKPISDQEDFRLAQLEDITIMKLSAICSRDEYKDYFDLACLASVTDVRSWVPWWQKLFPNNDPISWMVALSAVDQIPIIPLNVQSNFLAIDPIKIIKKSELEIVKFIQG
ncbi:MAG: nucleotidyl transferase AbiEii/AbiGii toxin family protein [Candidatus Yonathbacteria bacterium]|nr:nucleotidyl transferase AbiEii/AbiGii toxin family protein [Candidatus Yonathbacteria bacterium]